MTIPAAERALAGRDFGGALVALDDDDGRDTAPWLELRAAAAYGAGDYEGAVSAWERLHALHRGAGERVEAARAAVMTAMLLLVDGGMLSPVRGWIRRAEGLLEGEGPTPVHAPLAGVRTYERFFSGDLESSARHAREAVELGERFDVMAAVAIGRTALGRISVLRGEVDVGLAQLDEVAALLMSGEVDDLTTGIMFCELVCAAQGLLRPDLAQEWTDAMARWGVDAAAGAVQGRCRVHQAELLRRSGPCDDAERVALQACDELRPWLRREYGWPLVELGLIRLRRGDLSGAEEVFDQALAHCWPPHPGLALLRLEQGDVGAASRAIAAEIAHPTDAPSKELPPFGDLRLVPLLDAQSEIAHAAGDAATADAAARGLADVAASYRSPAITAAADLAAARVALLSGDADTAIVAAGAARDAFAAMDAPYDLGRARAVLAEALERAGSLDAADAEWSAARAQYARYGAARRAASLDGRVAAPATIRSQPSVRHRGAFRRDGAVWMVELAGHTARVKDLKGLRYLHRMVAEPNREFHVLDLVAVESGTLRGAGADAAGLPVLDPLSRDAYRRRLAEIDEDLEDAARCHDPVRSERAEAERRYLVDELIRGFGVGGVERRTGGSSERARTAVARALSYGITELEKHHPPAADHLRSALRTGTYCSYAPDPMVAVDWDLGR